MWHVEGFDAKDDAGDLTTLLRDRLLPYFRDRGFNIRAFATQASLGPRQFWLATEMAGFAEIDGWAARAGDEGGALLAELLARCDRIQAAVVEEM